MNPRKLRDLLSDAFDAGRDGRVGREAYLEAALADPIPWPTSNPRAITCRVHGGVVAAEDACQRHGICRHCAHPAGILD